MAVSTTDREKRVGLHLPLDVSGQDASGASFHESTRSLNISGGGILFESHRTCWWARASPWPSRSRTRSASTSGTVPSTR